MIKKGAAHNFALALLESGVDPEGAEQALLALRKAMLQNEKIRLFLESPRPKKEDKKRFLINALGNKVDQIVLNFLCVLVDRDRFSLFSEIIEALIQEVDNRLSRLKVRVDLAFSIEGLEEKDKTQLLEAFQKAIEGQWIGKGHYEKKEYQYIWQINTNKNLLGGFKIKIGDYVLDASVDRYIKDYLQRVNEKKRQLDKTWLT